MQSPSFKFDTTEKKQGTNGTKRESSTPSKESKRKVAKENLRRTERKEKADKLTKTISVRKQKNEEGTMNHSIAEFIIYSSRLEKSSMPSRESEEAAGAGSTEDKMEKQADESTKVIVVKKWKETNKE
ncbi:17513_t:CDS:2 [Acaulospora morrowiae]|uniref:17513_t:CDS:1 n=1 Tax=Acaulospora morrowiae TaxID=94023 RepID=A0A9N8V883_9GLOM|nr:17513_t:CDS:2 [Acaulospora morrowiae]